MYSTVLNTAYLFHTIGMMSVVINRLCSDFVSQGVHHCDLACRGQFWMDVPCCSWCLVIAPGTRMVAGYFKPRWAEEAQQSPGLLKYSTLCERLVHSVTFLKYHLGNHQIPESQTKVIKYLYRQVQAINKLFWISSHDWLSILLVLLMGQVSVGNQGLAKYPKFIWSVLLQQWIPPYTPG